MLCLQHPVRQLPIGQIPEPQRKQVRHPHSPCKELEQEHVSRLVQTWILDGCFEQYHDFLARECLFESHFLLFKVEMHKGVVGVQIVLVFHAPLDEGLEDFQVVCCRVLGHPCLEHVGLKVVQKINR